MRAVLVQEGRLVLGDAPDPGPPGPGQIRIAVRATAVNRADLLQREGKYPPPPGASPILGLEAAGVVEAAGEGTGWRPGDRVCALLSGGGYAETVVCPAGHVLPIPEGMDFPEAAALPEVLTTATLNLVTEAGMKPGDRVLIHAGGSGVGTAAIQLCRATGASCFVVAGSPEKIARCVELGASAGVDRKAGPWEVPAKAWGPFDIILDPVGGSVLESNISLLGIGGRLVVIGVMGGRSGALDLGRLLVKRLRVVGSVLRSRSDDEKTAILARLRAEVWPLVESGTIRPILDRTFPLADAEAAHALVASDQTFGKVVLTL